MRPATRQLFVILALSGVGAAAPAQGQDAGQGWSPESQRAAILGCRASILDNAIRDYLSQRNLTESQMPSDFRDRIATLIEPFLATCECSIPILAAEVSLGSFAAQSTQIQRRLRELTSPG